MKISIISSMYFAKRVLEIEGELKTRGHKVTIPLDTYDCIDKPELSDDLDFTLKHNLLMKAFKRIKESDAILVINEEKNGIKGYIGGATLMEIAVAYYLNKKIYILNKLPDESELPYICEVKQVKPIILNGDLDLIK